MEHASEEPKRWYAMRTVGNKTYIKISQQLEAAGMEYFIPMKEVIKVVGGKSVMASVPAVGGLIFCHGQETDIAGECLRSGKRLQFIYQRGKRVIDRIVVPDRQMMNFIKAATSPCEVQYLSADEAHQANGKMVRLHGGVLDGVIGRLTSRRGKKYTLLVELDDLMTVSVKFEPEVIEVLEE